MTVSFSLMLVCPPQLQESKDYALILKGKIEPALSKIFNGRIVRIIGEISTL